MRLFTVVDGPPQFKLPICSYETQRKWLTWIAEKCGDVNEYV